MNPKPLRVLLFPLLIGASIAAGIVLGYRLSGNQSLAGLGENSDDKISDALRYIMEQYVDTLNPKTFQDEAITALLSRLDPHSSYIPASDLQQVSEQLEGNFDGIGVEFNIQNDTIIVVAAISGGPSEALGIQSGDRIVEIEGKKAAGVHISNEDVIKKLRGKRNTEVKIKILRPGRSSLIPYTITRDKIPIYSVDAALMLDKTTGYIRISRFAATTYDEYLKAFNKLNGMGMKDLVLDLRDNPGGYLNAAVDLCDEFLPKGRKIVYTEGKARKKEEYNATTKGAFEKGGLIVLIDEGSASASEIVSGAVQDNDRGWVVGQRSFGKGLVQEEVRFGDGSAMRLTVARYYTPAGRCIQRPYTNGTDEYYKEITDRLSGNADTLKNKSKQDSVAYRTLKGRKVYGGGGVNPDFIVNSDTTGYSTYLAKVVSEGLINRFVFSKTEKLKSQLKGQYPNAATFAKDFNSSALLTEFFTFCRSNGLADNQAQQQRSAALLEQQLKALTARALYGNDGYYAVQCAKDKNVQKALQLLNTGRKSP